jgi:phosphoribosylformylglycinamidine synthase
MLVVAKTARIKEVQAIAAKWELDATPIGKVTDDGMYRCLWEGKVVVEIPGQRLVEDCGLLSRRQEDPRIADLRPHLRRTTHDTSPTDALLQPRRASIASKRWVFEQYDSTVQASTVIPPGGDAGVLRVRHTDFGIAVKTDCNSRLVRLDPYEGGKATVAEAARNVACTGARPLGITDCLNFGSPSDQRSSTNSAKRAAESPMPAARSAHR